MVSGSFDSASFSASPLPFATGSSTTGTSAEDESTASSAGASPAPVSSSLVVDGTTGVISSDSSISFVTAGSAATGASLKDYFMWIKKKNERKMLIYTGRSFTRVLRLLEYAKKKKNEAK